MPRPKGPFYKILVVDDDPSVVTLIKDNLERKAYQVLIAANGEEAMNKITVEHPHLVILDLMMPEMDGYDVCVQIKKNSLTKHIPVIMLTAKREHDSQITVATGQMADRYMTKPFDIMKLEDVVWELLKPDR